MINNESPFLGKRYIGNKETKLLHDLEKGNCPVPPELVLAFDFPKDAHEKGFTDCSKCMTQILLGFRTGGPPTNFSSSDNIRVIAKAGPGAMANKARGSIKGK